MRWLITAIALLVLGGPARAASIQARLVRAANESAPLDGRLQDIEPKLKRIFGYTHYRQIGDQQTELKTGVRLKLYPGEGFTMFVLSKSARKRMHELEIELYSGKVSVTKATVKIPEQGSVLLKGPEVGSTLIVVALTVRP
jgi:hypothetical protein